MLTNAEVWPFGLAQITDGNKFKVLKQFDHYIRMPKQLLCHCLKYVIQALYTAWTLHTLLGMYACNMSETCANYVCFISLLLLCTRHLLMEHTCPLAHKGSCSIKGQLSL